MIVCSNEKRVSLVSFVVVVRLSQSEAVVYLREWFDLESPNFTQTSTLTYTGYDVTNYFLVLIGSFPEKNCQKCHIRQFRVEFLENDLSEDPTHYSETISLANSPDMMSLAASGLLQNATKYCPKMHKAGATGKESYNSTAV